MKAASFLQKHSIQGAKYLQLDAGILHDIASLKLPFTSKNYYAFCDKYLDDDAHEALFLDGDDKYFREIATDYDTLKYFHYLFSFYKEKPVFCDIGCGIGNVVHYATKMGFDSFGYEINTGLAPIHKKVKAEVLYGNILKTDLSALKNVDILYLYRPINDTKLMNRLFKLIHANTGENVLICYNYPHKKSIKGYKTIELSEYEDMIILLKD